MRDRSLWDIRHLGRTTRDVPAMSDRMAEASVVTHPFGWDTSSMVRFPWMPSNKTEYDAMALNLGGRPRLKTMNSMPDSSVNLNLRLVKVTR